MDIIWQFFSPMWAIGWFNKLHSYGLNLITTPWPPLLRGNWISAGISMPEDSNFTLFPPSTRGANGSGAKIISSPSHQLSGNKIVSILWNPSDRFSTIFSPIFIFALGKQIICIYELRLSAFRGNLYEYTNLRIDILFRNFAAFHTWSSSAGCRNLSTCLSAGRSLTISP